MKDIASWGELSCCERNNGDRSGELWMWSPWLPDLTSSDFFLWGFFSGRNVRK